MPTARQGSIHLFRFSGIDVFLHWSWFLVAVYEIQSRAGRYTSITWNVLEYLSLFLIVMFHEFGHALACRQVGGKANQIVLWPLGGVAYVDPPPRPGATLWSIAAGPLVNVALIPVFFVFLSVSRSLGMGRELARSLSVGAARFPGSTSAFSFSTSFPSILWMAARFFAPSFGLCSDALAA